MPDLMLSDYHKQTDQCHVIMATGIIKKQLEIETGTAYAATNVSGSLAWHKIDNIVVFSGTLATTAAISAGGALATGLPSAYTTNPAVVATNNNAASSYYNLLLNGNRLNAGAAIPSGASLRVTGSYLCQ